MVKYVPVSWGVCYLPLSTYSFLSSRRCLSPFNAWEIVLVGSRFQKEQLNQSLPSSKLTWQWKITILIGDTSSKGPFSIVMLVYRSVFYPGFLPMFDNPKQNSFGHLSSHIVPSSYGLRDPVSLKCSFLTAEFLSSTKDSTKQIT